MIRFIWRNWWRHRERFILLLVGALIISSGLSYLVGLSDTNRGTIVDTLQKRWKASYDIVVRPSGSRSFTEGEGLLEPNYLSGIAGGITLEQYDEIKKIPGVEVAAPVAMIGYSKLGVNYLDNGALAMDFKNDNKFNHLADGIYRSSFKVVDNNGVTDLIDYNLNLYLMRSPWYLPKKFNNEFSKKFNVQDGFILNDNRYMLLVGIDPVQEAKLVGLDQSILPWGESRYFSGEDKAGVYSNGSFEETHIPVLISKDPFIDRTVIFTGQRLNLLFGNEVTDTKEKRKIANTMMEEIKSKGGKTYLDQIETVDDPFTYTFTTEDYYQTLIGSITKLDPFSGETIGTLKGSASKQSILAIKPSPLQFDKTQSPYPNRWPFAYQTIKQDNTDSPNLLKNRPYSFRELHSYSDVNNGDDIRLKFQFIGFYDPEKLKISKDPLTELPMETYRPPSAQLVLDGAGNPVNPPVTVKPTDNPLGILTSPPTMLTTLEAATIIAGDKPISAIRIKVEGVEVLNEDSQAKLERVAKEIEERTGLLTDITLGSSPQPTIVHVPQDGAMPALGWLEQPWVKIGTSITIFRETKLGFSGIIASVMLVAVVYVFATNIVSLLARRKELAVLLAVGWRPSELRRMVYLESLLLGSFVAFVSWSMTGVAYLQNDATFSMVKFLIMGLLGLIIYMLGSILPAMLVSRISPYETMRTGEISKASKRLLPTLGLMRMALSHFLGKWHRNLLSILSIAVPTTLLVFFLFITFRLDGILYTTWLGQYISVEIGPAHYIAMIISLIISILTTAEIMWQNVSERKPEIAFLKSFGYRNGSIRLLILIEGILSGLLAGLFGVAFGLLIIGWMYRQFPVEDIWYILSSGVIPIVVGLIGAVLPSEIVVRLRPSQAINGQYSASKKAAKQVKLGFGLTILTIIIGFITIVISILPNATAPNLVRSDLEESNDDPLLPVVDDSRENQNIGDLSAYTPNTIANGSHASYGLSFEMKENGKFFAVADIDITNQSRDDWDRLIFYFIPNVFIKENKPELLENSAELVIDKVRVNGELVEYKLDYDTLMIPLLNKLKPGEKVKLGVTYQFTVPERAPRFSKIGNNVYLAQWYPMLSTYQNGWNKEDYLINGESYYTANSNYKLNYKIPKGLSFVSSAEIDANLGDTSGQLEINNAKEVFVAILEGKESATANLDGIEIRIYGKADQQNLVKTSLAAAKEILEYYQQQIGPYPYKQLDIILDNEVVNMGYPGVVTINPSDDIVSLKQSLAHEIAHQWFYGVIGNDPYHDGWLDEGLAVLSASLFLYDHEKLSESESLSYAQSRFSFTDKKKPSNLPLSQYQEGAEVVALIYSQPALKLWELFSQYGGAETGLQFLKDYYDVYAFKQINTEEFVRFTKVYFNLEDNTFFEDWLELEE